MGTGTSVCLCTDGQLHIRQVIHPEAANKVSRLDRRMPCSQGVYEGTFSIQTSHKGMCYVRTVPVVEFNVTVKVKSRSCKPV